MLEHLLVVRLESPEPDCFEKQVLEAKLASGLSFVLKVSKREQGVEASEHMGETPVLSVQHWCRWLLELVGFQSLVAARLQPVFCGKTEKRSIEDC